MTQPTMNQKKIEETFIAKAKADPAFRTALMNNPIGAIEDELSESDLDTVAGGNPVAAGAVIGFVLSKLADQGLTDIGVFDDVNQIVKKYQEQQKGKQKT